MMELQKILDFEDTFNPLQYYCRLIELGIGLKEARRLSEIYEQGIYLEVMDRVREIHREEYGEE